MPPKSICICNTLVPFARGGAENHVESLQRELIRRGFEAEIVTVPFKWYPKPQIIRDALAWRLLDLTESDGRRVDMVIATRFPSYVIKHPHKVVWLIHQFRQVYDLYGTRYSDFDKNNPLHRRVMETVRRIDNLTLSEARHVYTNAQNTADRLAHYNQLPGEALYHPPKLDEFLHSETYGDYIFSAGRLNPMKRFDLLIRAMQHVSSAARCVIAGSGPQRDELQALVESLGVGDKVQLLGYTDDQRLIDLYANCFAVYYAPYDEDYGYVTLEAFKSRKPVITASDSGGVLEFVQDDVNGCVCRRPEARQVAAKIDYLFANRARCEAMGMAGYAKIKHINWDNVVAKLTAGL